MEGNGDDEARVSALERKIEKLRIMAGDKDRNIARLRRKLHKAQQDHAKISKERDSLDKVSKNLARDFTKNLLRAATNQLFDQARRRLADEQYVPLEACVKDLNTRKESPEKVLKKVEEIFGLDNRDLYLTFQGLTIHRGSSGKS